MDYRRLGRSNLEVSRLGLGAMGFGDKAWRGWVLDAEAARPVVRRALDAGINVFDTCDFYSAGRSEEILREVLVSEVPRDQFVLVTKVGSPMHPYPNGRGYSRKHILSAVDASLRRLGTDHIDLYQTHIWAPGTDLEEMVDAFDEVVRAGKVRYLGATTMPAWTFCTALHLARHAGRSRFVSMQCEYNPCHREAEREMIPLCQAENLALVPFSPIARGFLSADRRLPANNSRRTQTDDHTKKVYGRDNDYAVLDAVTTVAALHGVSPTQVAIAWTASRPGITAPIFGPTGAAHVDEAVGALSVRLREEDARTIEDAYQSRPIAASGH